MFKIFQRFPINITPLAPVGILQWIDTPQGRGGRPSGSPQSTSLSPRVPEEILEQLFLSFLLQSCLFWEERLVQCSLKPTAVRLKSGLKGSASSANQRRGLQLRQTMQIWSRYVKIEIMFCLFGQSRTQNSQNNRHWKIKQHCFCIMKHFKF